MTTLIVIDGHRPGNRRVEVAARLRSELARLNIKDTEAARRCGKTQAWCRLGGNGAHDSGAPLSVVAVDVTLGDRQIGMAAATT